jgi:hypothetical protein
MSTSQKTKGKGLEAFRAQHDKSFIVPARIKAGLVELGDSWEYEVDFCRRCSISLSDFAAYREPFLEFSVLTPRTGGRSHGKRVWCGSKAFAAKLREML